MRDSIDPMFNELRTGSIRLLLTLAAAAFVCASASEAQAKPPNGTFITFDIPVCPRDILPTGINPGGAITGTCVTVINNNFVFFGFLRKPDGSISTIAVPGSTSAMAGSEFTGGAAGPAINPEGAIAGSFTDISGATHGFLRARDGSFTTFDAPGAVNGTDFLCCITPEGAVAGISFDANFAAHGFLRAPNGTFAPFDLPGSTTTVPGGINPAEDIAGTYFDAIGAEHGFLRAREGTIATFDAPGAVNSTEAAGINPAGVIVGTYFDGNFQGHGFLRARDGTFTSFDPPGSAARFGTGAFAINPAGVIVGNYFDGTFFHGFIRASDGTFTTLDPPGSRSTLPLVINPVGIVAGEYFDASDAAHGFVFLPH